MGVKVWQENGAYHKWRPEWAPTPSSLITSEDQSESPPGLEKCTHLLAFTSASGCRASENLIFLVKIKFFPYMPIIFAMHRKCLLSDISMPALPSSLITSEDQSEPPSPPLVSLSICTVSLHNQWCYKRCCNYLRMSFRVRIIHVMPWWVKVCQKTSDLLSVLVTTLIKNVIFLSL